MTLDHEKHAYLTASSTLLWCYMHILLGISLTTFPSLNSKCLRGRLWMNVSFLIALHQSHYQTELRRTPACVRSLYLVRGCRRMLQINNTKLFATNHFSHKPEVQTILLYIPTVTVKKQPNMYWVKKRLTSVTNKVHFCIAHTIPLMAGLLTHFLLATIISEETKSPKQL